MAVRIAPDARQQFFDNQGNVLSGGLLFFYAAGSATKQNTYTDSTGGVANSNPIVLDADGRTPDGVWLTEGLAYKMVLCPANDTDPPTSPIWSEDNIRGINDALLAIDEWVASGFTPTYISGTSFSLAGDQTVAFHKSRRVKVTDAGGTKYGTIVSSAFAALTTVTIALDGGATLANPTSAVSLSVLTAVNPGVSPDMIYKKGTAVASAATTDIWSIVGDFVHVTGTVTITSLGTAPYAGARREIIFDGALTLTHNATSLILPGGVNITTAAGDRAIVRADTTANMIVIAYIKASGIANIPTPPRSYLAGCAMSTAGASATMTVAAGEAADSTNASLLQLLSATGKTTSAWAVGTGNGGLDTGAIANSTWYHFYLIKRTDTNVVDVVFSTNATSPTMPANYTLFRRIGSGKTNGSAQWILFLQTGDEFWWDVPILDINTTNPGTAAITQTLTVPTGVKVKALINAQLISIGAAGSAWQLSDLGQGDNAASTSVAPLGSLENGTSTAILSTVGAQVSVWTNTSAQIRSRAAVSDANTTTRAATIGWIDRRGRDS